MAEKNFYDRAIWRGPNGLRLFVLRRDPICCLCKREFSTVADHVIPWKSGVTEGLRWDLFRDADNLRGLCEACHNALGDKTKATGDGGRYFAGRVPRKSPGIEIEAEFGIKYVVSSLPQAVREAALAKED